MTKDKITIKVLKNGFSYFAGGKPRIRKDASIIYNWVERKLSCLGTSLTSSLEDKTSIKVVYPSGGTNETISTKDPKVILYALAAFLEDYLPKQLLSIKYRKYGEN